MTNSFATARHYAFVAVLAVAAHVVALTAALHYAA